MHNQLGYCYEFGIGTDIDKVKAFELYSKAAEKEYNIAQNNLALLYEKGEGTEKNIDKNAQYKLALLYEEDEGTEKNLEKAFYWYQKAAENNYEIAMNNLAIYYEYGKGTEKNLEKAFY